MPKNIAEEVALEENKVDKPEAEENPEDLTGAQLPDNSDSMESSSANLPASDAGMLPDDSGEKGPLDGLENLIPAEQVVLQYNQPSFPYNRLQLNERQLIHSQLLTSMLEANNRPEEQLPIKPPAGKLLLRLLVAIVLGAAFFFQFFGYAPINLTVVQSEIPAVQEFFKKLYTLPQEMPLLIAADFDPAFYGEMKLVSSPVFRHLILRSSRLVFVSTNPAGPLLGENLLRDALADLDRTKSGWGNYNTQQLTENLGYLPGGQSSLRELSFDIRKTTHFGLLTLRDRRWPWGNPALSGINTLADFGAVILLVDNLDNGRAWVEQVQPSLGQTPLLVISSAQARPMLEPYYLSGQVSGLISGVEDSSAYEQISGLPVAHAGELGLYRISVMFITGFILLGSVVVFLSLLPGWLRKLKGGRR